MFWLSGDLKAPPFLIFAVSLCNYTSSKTHWKYQNKIKLATRVLVRPLVTFYLKRNSYELSHIIIMETKEK